MTFCLAWQRDAQLLRHATTTRMLKSMMEHVSSPRKEEIVTATALKTRTVTMFVTAMRFWAARLRQR